MIRERRRLGEQGINARNHFTGGRTMTTQQGMVSRMALANELSSDIASAILAANERSQRPLNELKEIVLRVHSTLQEMAIKGGRRASSTRQNAEKGSR